jgi:hypothetical protein
MGAAEFSPQPIEQHQLLAPMAGDASAPVEVADIFDRRH